MNGYLNYMIEANIGLMLFLGWFHWLLRKENDYRLPRIFLLTALCASLIFPLIHAKVDRQASALFSAATLPHYWMPEIDIQDSSQLNENQSFFTMTEVAVWAYISGVLVFGLSFLLKLRATLLRICGSSTYVSGKLRICESQEDLPTFSFFNFIFIGQINRFTVEEKNYILRHEMVHAQRCHSLDIILIEIIKILFWFNPFLSYYKKAFVQLHEFEADAVATNRHDADQYCRLLARIALQSNGFTLANHFNNSLTVKRIAMLRSSKTKITTWKIYVCCLILPVAFIILSCQDQLGNESGQSTVITGPVDEHASPKGGYYTFYNMIKRNLRYPASSRREHQYGKVLVQFVVNERGALSNFEVIDSPDHALGDEVMRVLSLDHEWIPATKSGIAVKETLVLPVQFVLDIPGGVLRSETGSSIDVESLNPMKEIVVVGYTN